MRANRDCKDVVELLGRALLGLWEPQEAKITVSQARKLGIRQASHHDERTHV